MRTYCTRMAVVLATTLEIILSWSVSTYHLSLYASINSCVDSLVTEGGKDPASWLLHG